MKPAATPNPPAKKLVADPIVRLGDVRDLTTSDIDGNMADDGPISGNSRKYS